MLGFRTGLTNAENAFVIKGQRAQACIPPQIAFIDPRLAPVPLGFNAHQDMDDDAYELDAFDIESQWSAHSPRSDANIMDVDNSYRHPGMVAQSHVAAAYPADPAARYDRGAFTPVFEETSPDRDDRPDLGSSPLGPVTPFGEFVDRVVATVGYDRNQFPSAHVAALPTYIAKTDSSYTLPPFELPQELAPAPETVSAPSSTLAYKIIADPLADWMAMYVWKACTVGQSLPQKYMPRRCVSPSRVLGWRANSVAPAVSTSNVTPRFRRHTWPLPYGRCSCRLSSSRLRLSWPSGTLFACPSASAVWASAHRASRRPTSGPKYLA
jgi:hypothetical protein